MGADDIYFRNQVCFASCTAKKTMIDAIKTKIQAINDAIRIGNIRLVEDSMRDLKNYLDDEKFAQLFLENTDLLDLRSEAILFLDSLEK